MSHYSYIVNPRTQQVVVAHLKLANTFFSRFKGLLGSRPLQIQQGLLISPCQQVHTHFMGYTIDVIFLDKEFRVLHVQHQMRPWRISKYVKSAQHVLELMEHGAADVQIGDTLSYHALPHSI